MLLYVLVALIFSVIVGPATYFIAKYFFKKQFYRALGTSLFLVQIPKENPKEGGESGDAWKQGINKFEQLLSGLSALKQSFAFEVAVPHIGEEIHFYLAVPKKTSEV